MLPPHQSSVVRVHICHRLPGRTRLRIAGMPSHILSTGQVEAALRVIEGVSAVRINPTCASVVVYHCPHRPPTAALLHGALHTAFPTVVTPAPRALPVTVAAPPRPRTTSAARRQPAAECRWCKWKLTLARWLMADMWRCWQQMAWQQVLGRALAVKA